LRAAGRGAMRWPWRAASGAPDFSGRVPAWLSPPTPWAGPRRCRVPILSPLAGTIAVLINW